ncbi:MAG: phytanoyl-CoA dioxygenase family protein [Opitutaceae bacterium]|nr:phytanoyl-CoA dioxygenase family protein [Opitutaceae bacterium]
MSFSSASLPSPRTLPQLSSCGHKLDLSEASFGFVRSSADCVDDPAELNRRLAEDGYLYVPGFFDRDLIAAARAEVCDRLAAADLLDPAHPTIAGVARPGITSNYKGELAVHNAAIRRVVYGPELLGFYTRLFGEPVRHFDYTWFRALSRGQGSTPHCDLVYMGRGTHQLLTCWIPYGDTPLETGGVMLLEGSHRQQERLKNYLEVDVDTYCENRPAQVEKVVHRGGWSHPGFLSKNPVTLRAKLGGRWLTAPEWRMGDFITFGMHLVHGGLDNLTDRLRLSTDTRYQRASQPIDERWIGDNPIANTRAGKRGRVC